MRISCIITNYFPYGGQQRDFLRIASECSKRGHQVMVYTMKWEDTIPLSLEVNVLAAKGMGRLGQYRDFNRRALAEIRKHERHPVLGFSSMPGLDAYFAADPCFAYKARYSRGAYYRFTPRYRHFCDFERAVFDEPSRTRVFTLSELQEKEYLEFYPNSKSRLMRLPAGIPADRKGPDLEPGMRERLRQELGISGDEHLLLQVGSGFRVKGVDRALLAISSLPDEFRARVKYILVGQDKPARYLVQARKLDIENNFRVLPGTENVVPLYQAADLLIHPAYRESAGYTLLEAASNGLPVITTAGCGFAEEIDKNELGRVCEEPFVQEQLNSTLHEMLATLKDAPWSRNGLEYGKREELFKMPEIVADNIEQIGSEISAWEAN